MALFRWRCLAMTLIAIYMISNIVCGTSDSELAVSRLTDEKVCAALNYMHRYLPIQTSLQEKCRRYVILLFTAASDGTIYEPTVTNIINMQRNILDQFYESIDEITICSLYMGGVDKYRITQLGPPFLDLINCLRLMDTQCTRKYLVDQELAVLESLYTQIKNFPSQKIDIDSISLKLKKIRPSFRSILKDVLGETVRKGNSPYQTNVQLDPSNIAGTSCADSQQMRKLEEQELEERLALRKRERSRLNSRRRRIANPDLIREQCLKQREQRQVSKLERIMQTYTGDVPVEKTREEQLPLRHIRRKQMWEQGQRHVEMKRQLRERQIHLLEQFLPQYRQGLDSEESQTTPSSPKLPRRTDVVESEARPSAGPNPFEINHQVTFPSTLDQERGNYGEHSEQPMVDFTFMPPNTSDQLLNRYQTDSHIIDSGAKGEHSRSCNMRSTLQSSATESLEGSLDSRGPENFAAQLNDTDAFMQYLLDEPKTNETFTDPDQ